MTIHSPAQNTFIKSEAKLCAIDWPVNIGSDSLERKYRISATSELSNSNNLQLMKILAGTGKQREQPNNVGKSIGD